MGNASQSQLAKLAIGAADPVTFALNYAEFSPGVSVLLKDTNASKGVFDKDGNRVVNVQTSVTPRLSLEPTAAELAQMLAWAMWGTPTGSPAVTYPLGDVAPERYVYYAPRVGEQWFLSGVAVDSFTLAAVSGDVLRMDLDLLGKTVDATRNNFPALTLDQLTRPFTMSRLTLLVAGVERKARSFSFSVSHSIDRGRFLNSDTLTDHVKQDQSVRIAVDVPSGENSGLWSQGQSGVTVSATFTNGTGGIFSVSMADMRFGPRSPEHPGRGEGFLTLEGEGYRVSTGRPCTVTLNAAG